jgi:hypothetical protein
LPSAAIAERTLSVALPLRTARASDVVRKRWRWIVGSSALALLLVYVLSFVADEPLRRVVEREINARLKGYTMQIGSLHFHPIPFSLDLRDIVILQNPDFERPIIRLRRLSASVHWGAVVHGRVAANVEVDSPEVHVNTIQLTRGLHDPIPLNKKGRQEVLQALHSQKINEFVVRNGSVTYVEADQTRPLTVSRIEAVAEQVGRVPSAADVYPSPLRITGVVFDKGLLQIDGRADFLGVPHVAFKSHLVLDRIGLDYFAPLAARHGFRVVSGTVSANGHVEFAPQMKMVDLEELRIDGLKGDYAYHKRTARRVKDAAKATAEEAKKVSNEPGVVLKARRLIVRGATVGFVNEQATPRYRVFVSDTDLVFENFTNQFTEGTATARLTGRFMGSGATTITATFRPETKGADFDLHARIEDTDLKTMNDLFLAHAKVDVVSGAFSVFAETGVKNGLVQGYVKPLFRDLRLYGPEQDDEKSVGQKFKERASDLIAKVLRNRPRQEVATVVPLAGPLENPKADTWEALTSLLRNAFNKAILPGLERERFWLKR